MPDTGGGQTVDSAERAGSVFDPNSESNIADWANVDMASSAPPYTPLVGSVTSQNATQQERNEAFTPELMPNETLSYQNIQDQPNNDLTYSQPISNTSSINPQAYGSVTNIGTTGYQTPASNYNASQIAGNGAQANVGQYDMNTNVGSATAAQGTVDSNSLVDTQYNKLFDNSRLDANGVPDWARTAVTASNQQEAASGLGNSTMAAGATTGAILNAALPMAQFNAQQYSNMNMLNVSNQQQTNITNANNKLSASTANLNADQQTYLTNLQNQQQTLVDNTSWDNAAKQFNATNDQQNNQFFAGLLERIASQNASAANTMSSFNAGQTNGINQFLSNQDMSRQQFNSSNQLLVDQSNVKWQRSINTANTAGQNAANQANVMNTFDIQQSGLNNLWQQARDEASWSLTSGENSQNRGLSLVNSSMNRLTSEDILNSQLEASMFSQLGSFGTNLLSGFLGGGSGASGLGAGLSNLLFGNNGGSGAFSGFSGSAGGDQNSTLGDLGSGNGIGGTGGGQDFGGGSAYTGPNAYSSGFFGGAGGGYARGGLVNANVKFDNEDSVGPGVVVPRKIK